MRLKHAEFSRIQMQIPSTIEDASVYTDIKAALQNYGYATNAPDPIP